MFIGILRLSAAHKKYINSGSIW